MLAAGQSIRSGGGIETIFAEGETGPAVVGLVRRTGAWRELVSVPDGLGSPERQPVRIQK